MIGVIGLGNMGHAIATRLLAVGEEVCVWNRTAEKANDLSGVKLASSPAELASHCDVILSILANDTATEAVYFGDLGLLHESLEKKVIVEMCTMAPATAQALEAAVLGKQGRFLECPVGGTIGPALEGKLLGLAGGNEDAFIAAKPVLNHLTRRLEHFGPVGTGAAMKLAVNLPLMVYWSALGEALGIATSHDVDPVLALDVLADTSGAIGAAKKRIPPITQMVVNGDCGTSNFSLQNAIKDMELMVATADEQGEAAQVIRMALAKSKSAYDSGFGSFDCSLVAAFGNTVE